MTAEAWTPSQPLLDEVKRLITALISERNAPGVAWGLFTRAGLVASGGHGVAALGGATPTSSTVFRVASMSKSFTAAAILTLVEAKRLRLDDPIAEHVAEMATTRRYSGDSPLITLAHLLAMSSGLPKDDPWADRQEALHPGVFSRMIAGGLRTVGAPGVAFDYSNVGYALLGAVVERVSGMPFVAYVRERLLEPLGLRRTFYDYTDVAPSARATGYHDSQGRWVPEVFTGPGAFSPIGGVLSTVEDMATWATWLADGFPPTDDDAPSPLSRASRRSMQTGHIDIPPVLRSGSSRGRATMAEHTQISSYGYGLFVDHDPVWGNIAQHSGGYPGFGTAMRWHLDSGIGVIVLANGRYARSLVIADRALRIALADAGAVGRTVRPWPETLRVKDLVTAELLAGRDPFDLPIYTDNVAMDQPWDQRRADLAVALERTGALTAPGGAAPGADFAISEAHIGWTLPGARGSLTVEVQLTPQDPPRVQSIKLRSDPTFPPDDVTTITRSTAIVGTPIVGTPTAGTPTPTP
ncbi:MAG: beta-lactamase family protein, partial [Bifidobacteriaceae bacterium]|nr:beta-lactamase family protein [Bifidobacteriaceae bacterium]